MIGIKMSRTFFKSTTKYRIRVICIVLIVHWQINFPYVGKRTLEHSVYIRRLLVLKAHIWMIFWVSICWRHLVISKESLNLSKFSEKTYFTSCVRDIFWASILYKYLGPLVFKRFPSVSIYCVKFSFYTSPNACC